MDIKVTPEQIESIDLKSIAENPELGKLNFKESLPAMEAIQKLFLQLSKLRYSERLTPSETEKIDRYKVKFAQHLSEARQFEIGRGEAENQNKQLQEKFKRLKEECESELRSQLTYLKQLEIEEVGGDTLRQQFKEATKAKEEYDKLSVQLKKYLEQLELERRQIEERKDQIATQKGEVAALSFGKHFETQAASHNKGRLFWLKIGSVGFFILFVIVVLNLVVYLENPSVFTWQYFGVKFALLLLISYFVGFCSRQFRIHSHLFVSNLQRKNAAETVRDFYESDVADYVKNQVVEKGTNLIFSDFPIGHIAKAEGKDNEGPIQQIFQNVTPPKIL